MSTHNICFHGEIIKILCRYPFLSGTMTDVIFFYQFRMYEQSSVFICVCLLLYCIYPKYLDGLTPFHICPNILLPINNLKNCWMSDSVDAGSTLSVQVSLAKYF